MCYKNNKKYSKIDLQYSKLQINKFLFNFFVLIYLPFVLYFVDIYLIKIAILFMFETAPSEHVRPGFLHHRPGMALLLNITYLYEAVSNKT